MQRLLYKLKIQLLSVCKLAVNMSKKGLAEFKIIIFDLTWFNAIGWELKTYFLDNFDLLMIYELLKI